MTPQDVFCSTKPSWQGGSLRAPVASPRPWLCQGIDPIQSQQNVSPFNHSRENSLSLHPSTWRAFLPPRPLTISWRPTLRGLDAAILPKMDHSQGPIAAPEPSSSDLENCLSTDTEPCAIDRSIDPRSGERSCYSRYPHDHVLETTSSRKHFQP